MAYRCGLRNARLVDRLSCWMGTTIEHDSRRSAFNYIIYDGNMIFTWWRRFSSATACLVDFETICMYRLLFVGRCDHWSICLRRSTLDFIDFLFSAPRLCQRPQKTSEGGRAKSGCGISFGVSGAVIGHWWFYWESFLRLRMKLRSGCACTTKMSLSWCWWWWRLCWW